MADNSGGIMAPVGDARIQVFRSGVAYKATNFGHRCPPVVSLFRLRREDFGEIRRQMRRLASGFLL
jgi:hypothetical protein